MATKETELLESIKDTLIEIAATLYAEGIRNKAEHRNGILKDSEMTIRTAVFDYLTGLITDSALSIAEAEGDRANDSGD